MQSARYHAWRPHLYNDRHAARQHRLQKAIACRQDRTQRRSKAQYQTRGRAAGQGTFSGPPPIGADRSAAQASLWAAHPSVASPAPTPAGRSPVPAADSPQPCLQGRQSARRQGQGDSGGAVQGSPASAPPMRQLALAAGRSTSWLRCTALKAPARPIGPTDGAHPNGARQNLELLSTRWYAAPTPTKPSTNCVTVRGRAVGQGDA